MRKASSNKSYNTLEGWQTVVNLCGAMSAVKTGMVILLLLLSMHKFQVAGVFHATHYNPYCLSAQCVVPFDPDEHCANLRWLQWLTYT